MDDDFQNPCIAENNIYEYLALLKNNASSALLTIHDRRSYLDQYKKKVSQNVIYPYAVKPQYPEVTRDQKKFDISKL
jgi:hypothetical protein